MRLETFDLNLLRALEHLLRERNVTRAAERMNLTQSAMSGMLRRLRDVFQDDLLMRVGREYRLTPRGEELSQPVAAALRLIRGDILDRRAFDPAVCDRHFRILSADYTTFVVLAGVICEIATEAPLMTFNVVRPGRGSDQLLERGELDLSLVPETRIANPLLGRFLIEDDFSVIGWQANASVRGELTEELFLRLPHIAVQIEPGVYPVMESWLLNTYGVRRRVEVYVSSFLDVPGLIVGTNRIAVVHSRFASAFMKTYPLRRFGCPVPGPRTRLALKWHAGSASDIGLQWLIRRICAYADKVQCG